MGMSDHPGYTNTPAIPAWDEFMNNPNLNWNDDIVVVSAALLSRNQRYFCLCSMNNCVHVNATGNYEFQVLCTRHAGFAEGEFL